MTTQEMEQLSTMVADKIKEGKFAEDTGTAILILHSLEHQATGAGRVIDAAKAKATPCKCFSYDTDKVACWSEGVLGLMTSEKNPEQIAQFCAMGKIPAGDGAKQRFKQVREAITEAHKEWEAEGGDLKKWWEKTGEKLEEKGIEL